MPTGKLEWGKILGKLSPYTIQKGFRYLKHYGPKEFWIRLHEMFEPKKSLMVRGMNHTDRIQKNWKNKKKENGNIIRRSVLWYRHIEHRKNICGR